MKSRGFAQKLDSRRDKVQNLEDEDVSGDFRDSSDEELNERDLALDFDGLEVDEGLSQDEEAETEDDEQDTAPSTSWGKGVQNYYEGNLDESSSEDGEDLDAQIEEANRIANEQFDGLEEGDFSFKDIIKSGKGFEHDAALKRGLKDRLSSKREAFDALDVLEKELNFMLEGTQEVGVETGSNLPILLEGLTEAEQVEMIKKMHPEFLPLVEDMKEKFQELNERIEPLLQKIELLRHEDLSDDSLTFLKAKNQTMLAYLSYLTFYLLLKIDGHPVENHPVIERLCELRFVMEKLRPIEEKASYRIQKTLSTLEKDGQTHDEASSAYRPHPERLVASSDEETVSAGELSPSGELDSDDEVDDTPKESKLYKPKKMLAVEYTHDAPTQLQRVEKDLERQKKRLRKSELIKDLRTEFTDEPEELGGRAEEDVRVSAIVRRHREREQYEEDNLIRLPVTKKDRKELMELKRLKKLNVSAGSTLDDLTSFAESIVDEGKNNRDKASTTPLGSYLNAATQAKKAAENDLLARRAADNVVVARRTSKATSQHIADDDIRGYDTGRVADEEVNSNDSFEDDEPEDEMLNDLLAEKAEKKYAKKKAGILKASEMLPKGDSIVKGRRAISRQIEENKGMVRKRKRIEGNSRAHYRQKFEKKVKKLQGGQKPGKQAGTRYAGESSGIRSKVKKSVSFKD